MKIKLCTSCNKPKKGDYKNLCQRCYGNHLYKTSSVRRKLIDTTNAAWKKKHPEAARIIQRRAQKKYHLKLKKLNLIT